MMKQSKSVRKILLIMTVLAACIMMSTICASAETVNYIDKNGDQKSANCGIVNSGMTKLSNGWYEVSGNVTFGNRIYTEGEVHLILCDGAHLLLKKGLHVSSGSSIFIYAQSTGENRGKLTASSTTERRYVIEEANCAAIGGNEDETNGDITINGGNIYAHGGENGAGIGGGNEGHGGNITINGGRVEAIGGYEGAGIGGGDEGNAGNITINGGEVIVHGGSTAAGIGGGDTGDGGHIVIKGGNVNATAGNKSIAMFFPTTFTGAAIGGGRCGHAGKIEIFGGKIKAHSYFRGAAIGSGGDNNSSSHKYSTNPNSYGGEISIYGGNIIAHPQTYELGVEAYNSNRVEHMDGGAGIGSGAKSYGVKIYIAGGIIEPYASYYDNKPVSAMKAHFTGKCPSAAIGNGYDAKSNGQVTIDGSENNHPYIEINVAEFSYEEKQTAVGDAQSPDRCAVALASPKARIVCAGRVVKAEERLDALTSKESVKVYWCGHDELKYQTDDTYHWKGYCEKCGQDDGKIKHSYDGYLTDDNQHWQKCRVCGYVTDKKDHEFDKDGNCLCGVKGLRVSVMMPDNESELNRTWHKKGEKYVLPDPDELYKETELPEMADFRYWQVNDSFYEYKKGDTVVLKSDTVVAPVYGASWSAIKQEIETAENGAVVKLPNDCTARETDTHIVIAKNKRVTIDLNGHKLNRDFQDYMDADKKGTGDAILVKGSLTITDSGEDQSGEIRGGRNVFSEDGRSISGEVLGGGAITVAGGTATLKSGSISGNISNGGSGVGIFDNGAFIMEGGSICENTGLKYGSGVYVANGVLTMKGGLIFDNRSTVDGCAGVQFGDTGAMQLEGTVKIINNQFIDTGSRGWTNKNVSLNEGQTIRMTGDLINSAIGVTTASGNSVITRGLKNIMGSADNFVSDSADYVVAANKDGEACLVENGAIPPEEFFDITINESEHGQVQADRTTAVSGTAVGLLAVPEEGYRIADWGVSGEYAGFETEGNSAVLTMGSDDITITPVFEAIPVNDISVSVVKGAEETPIMADSQIDLNMGDKLQLKAYVRPDNVINKSVRWIDEDSGNFVHIDEQTGALTAEKAGLTSVTATSLSDPDVSVRIYIAVSGNAVTFDSDGGEGASGEVYVRSGDVVKKPADPVREGYEFKGWHKVKEDGTTVDEEYDFSSEVESNFTLRAVWEHTKHDDTTLTHVNRIDETCTTEGTQEHWRCSVCGRFFDDAAGEMEITEAQTRIPAAHKWGAWEPDNDGQHIRKCSACPAEETDTHKWDEGVVITQPTHEASGQVKYTCVICGETRTEPFDYTKYAVTVKRSGAGTSYADPKEGWTDEVIHLYSEPGDGYKFVAWDIRGRGAVCTDVESKNTTVKIGTARITATAVFEPILPESISVHVIDGDKEREVGKQLELKAGGSVKLKPVVRPSDANDEVIWDVKDEQYATVAEDGTLNALKPGKTEITATSRYDSMVSFSFELVIKEGDKPAPAPATVPASSVTINSKTVNAQVVDSAVRSAGGDANSVTDIVLGKSVKKISKGSFAGLPNAKTLVVQSKKLKKKTVKGSLKGSQISSLKVKVGSKKTNKKYVRRYKKIFTKKNAGRKAKVSL